MSLIGLDWMLNVDGLDWNSQNPKENWWLPFFSLLIKKKRMKGTRKEGKGKETQLWNDPKRRERNFDLMFLLFFYFLKIEAPSIAVVFIFFLLWLATARGGAGPFERVLFLSGVRSTQMICKWHANCRPLPGTSAAAPLHRLRSNERRENSVKTR